MLKSRMMVIMLFIIPALAYQPVRAELQAELSQDQLAFLRECIKEKENSILGGVYAYLHQREPRFLERLALSKWVVANPALTLEDKYGNAQQVVWLSAYLGDIGGAEKALAGFLQAYRKADMTVGGCFGVRKVQFYLPEVELGLRCYIEGCKCYLGIGGSESHVKAIQYYDMQRDFNLAHFSEVLEKNRDELQLSVYFGYYQGRGMSYEEDGDTTSALREYREALRNYDDRNLAGLDLIEPLKKAVAEWGNVMRDKILLLSGDGGGVRPEEAYRMYKEIIEYHAPLDRSDIQIAKQYLQRFKQAFAGKTFSVDGVVGPRDVKEYVPLESLRFEAIIEESRRNHDLAEDFSGAIDKWTQYRDRVASLIPSIQDATVRNSAKTYAEFSFRAHCGRLFNTDKNRQKALEFMKEAMKRFDEMKASGVQQNEETKREYAYLEGACDYIQGILKKESGR
jgi:tetratricopeptide (TPR) repeat protein